MANLSGHLLSRTFACRAPFVSANSSGARVRWCDGVILEAVVVWSWPFLIIQRDLRKVIWMWTSTGSIWFLSVCEQVSLQEPVGIKLAYSYDILWLSLTLDYKFSNQIPFGTWILVKSTCMFLVRTIAAGKSPTKWWCWCSKNSITFMLENQTY